MFHDEPPGPSWRSIGFHPDNISMPNESSFRVAPHSPSRRRLVHGGLALAGTLTFGLLSACARPVAQEADKVSQFGPSAGNGDAGTTEQPAAGPPQSGGALTVGMLVAPTDDFISLDPHRGSSLARHRL